MASLEDLHRLRSLRAVRLKAHLDWLAAGGAWPVPPWHRRPGAPSADAVHVEPDVVLHDPSHRPASLDDEVAQAIVRRDPVERHRRPWEEIWPSVRRAVVLGRPGEGKSTLLQRTCRAVARDSALLWDERRTPLDEIPIPIWLTAYQVIAAGSVQAALEDAVTTRSGASGRRLGVGGAERRLVSPLDGLSRAEVLAALDNPTTWVFIDALDERPADQDEVKAAQRVSAALSTLSDLRCRVLLSVRTYEWDPKLLPSFPATNTAEPADDAAAIYELAPLSDGQRRNIVGRWHAGDAGRDRRERLTELLDVAPMRELTNNALLLTLLCAATLNPSRSISRATRRAELYRWLIEDMVAREDKLALSPGDDTVQDRLPVLERAAWDLWVRRGGAAFTRPEWTEAVREAAGRNWTPAGRKRLLRDVDAAGLLIKEGDKRRLFPQTVFEYLAGAGLVQRAADAARPPAPTIESVATTLVDRAGDVGWRELFTLAIGHLAVVRRRPDVLDAMVHRALDLRASGSPPGAVAAVLGEGLVESGERDPNLPDVLLGLHARQPSLLSEDARIKLVQTLRDTMESAVAEGDAHHVPAIVRAGAGSALGWIGDPRFHGAAYWGLPNDDLLGFVRVPPPAGGVFQMGSPDGEAGADSYEKPLQPVRLREAFYIARWPVTVAQFALFVQRSGHNAGEAWKRLAANHAVAFVSWRDAVGYCAWLNERLLRVTLPPLLQAALGEQRHSMGRWRVTLPTEPQWEWAARGPDRHISPTPPGTQEPVMPIPLFAMMSPVGCFTLGASWCGVEDMTMYEWTRSRYQPHSPFLVAAEDAGRDGLDGNECRVQRRGFFPSIFALGPPVPRPVGWPDARHDGLWFRVALCPFRS